MDSALRPADPPPVPLRQLVSGMRVSGEPGDVAVTGVTLDSRAVRPGWLYVALPGATTHGALFAAQALDAGAAAVLTDDDAPLAELPVPVLRSPEPRHAAAVAASRVFGEPSRHLAMFGVTGTNGKTTTVALLEAGLAAAGRVPGTVGTIGFRLAGQELRSGRSTVTTPESPDLQAMLAAMRERGADAVALEVSSHALALQRVDAVAFDVTAFLNLGRDHLDFHTDLDDYFEAKARLFEPGRSPVAVVWVDDPKGREIAARVARDPGTRLVTVGTGPDTDYVLRDYEAVGSLGGRATLTRDGGDVPLEIALPGVHNMIDAAVAFAMLEAAGIAAPDALTGLRHAQVPGRMQRVDLGPGAPTVVVDFAHTPQAVGAAVDALAAFPRVISVLGCGGDRDPDKRPGMGAAASRGSDLTVITDDNPRTEDPARIRAQTLAGALEGRRPGAEVIEVAGRRAAIETALRAARPDSVVAILGKGHERGQILADRVVDFDDVEEATRAWRRLVEEGASDAPAQDV